MTRRLVYLESPLAGDVVRNVAFARACMRDSVMRGEAPFASHLLYAQEGLLDDLVPEERAAGIECGLSWAEKAEATVVYMDFGVSPGMKRGIESAKAAGRTVEYRFLYGAVKP